MDFQFVMPLQARLAGGRLQTDGSKKIKEDMSRKERFLGSAWAK